MTAPIRLPGARHCCACAAACWHIGGPWFCDEHKEQAAAVTPLLVPARDDDAFARRLRQRIKEDEHILARLGDKPCPAKVEAVLGFEVPTQIPCAQVEGHKGRHRFVIEWDDPSDGVS
jgi:hypothetical protein